MSFIYETSPPGFLVARISRYYPGWTIKGPHAVKGSWHVNEREANCAAWRTWTASILRKYGDGIEWVTEHPRSAWTRLEARIGRVRLWREPGIAAGPWVIEAGPEGLTAVCGDIDEAMVRFAALALAFYPRGGGAFPPVRRG